MANTTEKPRHQYEVLSSFTDPVDNNTAYWAGKDLYPRAGYAPTEARIANLQGKDNLQGKPLIGKAKK